MSHESDEIEKALSEVPEDMLTNVTYHRMIQRLPLGRIPELTRKPVMTVEKMRDMLTGHVIVEEKLDGSLETQANMDKDVAAHWENLTVRHSVFYDRLPSFYIILDISTNGKVLKREERNPWGITPPLIDDIPYCTPDLILPNAEMISARLAHYLDRKSQFASDSKIEGVVIKNYEKQLFGKIVNLEFFQGIVEEGNYLRRRPQEYNRRKPR